MNKFVEVNGRIIRLDEIIYTVKTYESSYKSYGIEIATKNHEIEIDFGLDKINRDKEFEKLKELLLSL